MPALRVLVIGGYGLFGRRLVERLALQGDALHLIVAGRSLDKAAALVKVLESSSPGASLQAAALDARSPQLASEISRLSPQVVVHTAGPFQGQDYHVASSCIAAGAHYIDLADGREFVAGIGVLDSAARAAGVAVIAGASSVPALSGAVADELAAGMSEVHEIDIGISPGNRTERGLATVAAVLGYCGKPLPVPAGVAPVFGWLGSRVHRYSAPVGKRRLSPCDVPDLTLLPPRYPGRPVVQFSAGLELTLLHRGMNLMALLARRGWVHDWSGHARWLWRVAGWLRPFGSDAGAMHVGVHGRGADGQALARQWQLVATHDDGPFVPTLAAAALIRKFASAAWPPGARPCLGLLSLDDFARESAGLHIEMGELPSLFEHTLGTAAYSRLAPALQRFHRLGGGHRLEGHVSCEAPATPPARALAWCLRSPLTARQGAMHFELDASPQVESWVRAFPGRTMRSTLERCELPGRVIEQLGPARLWFDLDESGGGLQMRLAALRFAGIRCPRWLMPAIEARESGDSQWLRFDVHVELPMIGRVAGYRGELRVSGGDASA